MAFMIEDGKGKGYSAEVNADNQISVFSESASLQHVQSHLRGGAYQVQGFFTAINNSTHPILHIKNNSSTLDMVVTYIRMQILDFAGGTALPSTSTYFRLAFDRTYSAAGAEVTPVNMNKKVGNVAPITVYNANPTLVGTASEFDRWYVKSEGDMQTYNKEGTLILGLNDTMEVDIVSDHTSGTAVARVSFVMVAQD